MTDIQNIPTPGQSHWCDGRTLSGRGCKNVVADDSDHCEAGHPNKIRTPMTLDAVSSIAMVEPALLSVDDLLSLSTAVDILYMTLTKDLYDQLHEEQPEVEALAQQVHHKLAHRTHGVAMC